MKKVFVLFIMLSFLCIHTKAQESSYKTETIDASTVPALVSSSFNEHFADPKVIRWEKHIYTNKQGKSFSKYVCIFDFDGLRSRSRYTEEGTGITATTYYWFKNVEKLPESIKNYAKTKYPDFTLNSGEKEKSHKSGKYVYRIRLKKGASKLVIYLNENGEEVSKDNIDKEILETEDESM